MTQRIAINGFGRIGRGVLRAIVTRDLNLEVVAINDLAHAQTLAHLYNFDSVYGRAHPQATVRDNMLEIAGRQIRLISEPAPHSLPWAELQVDAVLEATGRFTAADKAGQHIAAGAKRVLISAPSADADVTLVRGVNWQTYQPGQHRIISNGSCTTNALAPLLQVLHRVAHVQQGMVSTVHAYTQDQQLVDSPHADLRRARAAGLNIVPTSTGAAKAIGKVIPELAGKLIGDAIRVPVPVGSIVEVVALVEQPVSTAVLRKAYELAAATDLAGVLECSSDPLVSSDIVQQPASCIIDADLLRAHGTQVRVSGWYDNEWAFANRAAETLQMITS